MTPIASTILRCGLRTARTTTERYHPMREPRALSFVASGAASLVSALQAAGVLAPVVLAPVVLASVAVAGVTLALDTSAAAAQTEGGPGGSVTTANDDLFPAMFAAPREVASYFSVLSWESPALDARVASMGIGDAFPLALWGTENGVRARLAIEFAVLAQFDLDGPSFDFVNADFFVGIPVSARRGRFAVRGRFYHWSAHLGDEFLIRSGLPREEMSVEALEVMLSEDLGPVRLIGGAVSRLRRFPKELSESILRTGMETRPGEPLFRAGPLGWVRPVAGVDVRWTNREEWSAGLGAKLGLEVDPGIDGRRAWRVMFEYFDGPSPYGQFFRENLRFVGVGLQLR